MIKLRPYQVKGVKAVMDSYNSGVKKVGMVMGVGTGKTVTFSAVIDEMIKKTGKKALILAHREELLTQAGEDLALVNPKLTFAVEQGTNHADMDVDVIIASVPTIGRGASDRILKFDPEEFSVIVTDEMHHFTNKTYTNIFEHFHSLKSVDDDNKRLLLGVTATGFRSDDQKLEDIIDDIVFEYPMLTAIKQGYLANLRAYTVKTRIDISNVRKSGDDFNMTDLAKVVNRDNRNQIILDTYQDYCKDQQTLIFAVNVQHAINLYNVFKMAGIKAEYVVGTTPKDERKTIVADFKTGKINVLINVGVFTEGTNLPQIQNIIMAKPTRSLGLYIQMIGRATRLATGKTHAVIYDIVDNAGTQGIQTMSSILGVDGNLDFQGKDLIEIKDFVDKLRNLSPNINWSKVDVNDPTKEIKRLDLLAGLCVPPELVVFTDFAWFKQTKGQYKINLGQDASKDISYNMFLRENALGKYGLYFSTFKKSERKTTWMKYEKGLSLQEAVMMADKKINETFSDRFALITSNAPWRSAEPTESQLKILRKMKVNPDTISQLNKGQASFLLDKLFSEKPKKILTPKTQHFLL
jgi:superfamily II DNA or RNA helicase